MAKKRFKVEDLQIAKGVDTRTSIFRYLQGNPGATQRQVADYLGLNKSTVSKHVAIIRGGWVPSENR